MDATAGLHPTDQTLHDYGLGKLDVRSSDSVEQHLDDCDDCRRRVGELSGDSFLGRLQHAQHPNSTPPPPPPAGSLPPELASHPDYEVLRELGRGGMGVVYLANNRLMGRPEVLKVVGKHLIQKPNVLDRFLREIRSAARLQHPNIVAAYSAMRLGDGVVLAMEYVDGLDLAQMVKAKGALPVTHAAYFVHQAALGLQHAHERGMVHRDIKPANLILARDGRKAVVKVLDFGLAKVTSEAPVDGGLTQEGQMLGTPDYIAPEQTINAQKADIRADIYSLGCTLYYLLTGGPPFRGTSLYDILQAHHSMDAKLLNLVRPEVPVELAALVAKMMAKDPERRFQTPGAVAQALAPFFKPGAARGPGPDAEVPRVQASARAARPAAAAPAAEAAKPTAAPAPEPVPPRPNPSRKVGAEGVAWESLIEFKETERSTPEVVAPQPPAAAGPGARRPWVGPALAAGAMLLALAVAWAAMVLAVRVKTPDGTIVLEGLPDHAEVLVDGSKVRVVVPGRGGPAEVSVPPGRHGVEVKTDGVKVFGEQVTVELGDRAEIHVRLDRSDIPPKRVDGAEAYGVEAREGVLPALGTDVPRANGAGAAGHGFVALFNGKDLTGWKIHPSQPGNWRVEDGVLTGSGPQDGRSSNSHLYSERGDYKDFYLRAEVRINDGGNSGVSLRSRFGPVRPQDRPTWPDGYEAQINSTHWNHDRTGSLRAGVDHVPVVVVRDPPVPAGQWFELVTIADGNRIVVMVDGKITADYFDASGLYSRGHIVLQQMDARTVAEFRKVEIKELNPTTVPAGAGGASAGAQAIQPPTPAAPTRPVKVLIITGDNLPAHNWKGTTIKFREILNDPARFQVDVTATPAGDLTAGNLARYDVLLLNYKDTPRGGSETHWSEANRAAFLEAVTAQGKGLYVHHFSSGAFTTPNWAEFERATAGGFRNQGHHGPAHGFAVVKKADLGDPLFRSLPESFEHVRDELYAGSLLTPGSVVLATAYSNPARPRGTGKDEPVIWANQYGRGRVVHNVLGHDTVAMSDPIYQQWVRQVIAWAAQPATGPATSEAGRPARVAKQGQTPGPTYDGQRPPADAEHFQGMAYKAFPRQITWHEARKACQEMGGHLAIVTGGEVNQFLVSLLNRQGIDAAWLGATDEGVEGRWAWVDGTPARYNHWDIASKQPDNKEGIEHYMVLLTRSNGGWADQPNDGRQDHPGFICQWD